MKIEEILSEHALWLKDSSKGKRADLRDANLRNANLVDADLRGILVNDSTKF